ncbi:MAG: phosphoglucosamine mutase [Candidatus Dependentiae bacterium]
MFGTDGIRATVGTSPFTASNLYTMGMALGKWIVQTYGNNATVLIGHDTRLSCSFVKSSLKSGLLSYPVCLIDTGVMPTPAIVQLTLKHKNIDCGIVISASHNPFQDNGIKIIDSKKGKLSVTDEEIITTYYDIPEKIHNYAQLGEERYWQGAYKAYCDYVVQFFEPNFLHGKKIVLDCAHGATHRCGPELFEYFGATVIPFAHQPNGKNINEQCGAVHPEHLTKVVLEHNADAGFAFDGDGDRVIAVNNKGEIRDGDDILALLLDHPIYTKTPIVVGTIMTNKGLEVWLEEKNCSLFRTPVGDKYIARKLQEDNLIIGGEQSGHTILHDYLPSGDGIFTALRVMESIIYTDNTTMQTFKRFPQILINVPIKNKKDLTQEPFASIIKHNEQKLSNGRLVVRFSGTEQKLRVMVENDNEIQANEIGHTCATELQKALEG